MEKLGKTLTNRCRAVRELKEKKHKTQRGTRGRHINSEQLEFECQFQTPTRSRIQELLNLGTSSSHNFFQSLIINQDLLRLREDMWPNHRTRRNGGWCRAYSTAIKENVLHATDYNQPQNNSHPPFHNATPALKLARKRNICN